MNRNSLPYSGFQRYVYLTCSKCIPRSRQERIVPAHNPHQGLGQPAQACLAGSWPPTYILIPPKNAPCVQAHRMLRVLRKYVFCSGVHWAQRQVQPGGQSWGTARRKRYSFSQRWSDIASMVSLRHFESEEVGYPKYEILQCINKCIYTCTCWSL